MIPRQETPTDSGSEAEHERTPKLSVRRENDWIDAQLHQAC